LTGVISCFDFEIINLAQRLKGKYDKKINQYVMRNKEILEDFNYLIFSSFLFLLPLCKHTLAHTYRISALQTLDISLLVLAQSAT
jgi:hypothetical protein